MSNRSGKFWRFGTVVGLVVALVVTSFFTLWAWLSNPGGIFRDEAGTNWQFVVETAMSWFIPTFVAVTVIAGLAHLARSAWMSWRSKN